MANRSLTAKLVESPQTQVVISPSGKPSYLQIPWEVFLSLAEREKETLEILSNPTQAKIILNSLKEAQEGKTLPIENLLKQ